MSVPNQRKVIVNKLNTQPEPFVTLNLKLMADVYQDLHNAHAFYLYLCLCGNQDKYKFDFSPQAISNKFHLPKSTANEKFHYLIEKKYLVPIKEGSNIYNFYSAPAHLHPQPETFEF